MEKRKTKFDAFAEPLVRVVNYTLQPGETIWDVADRFMKVAKEFKRDMEKTRDGSSMVER